jgi:hypothetical protein
MECLKSTKFHGVFSTNQKLDGESVFLGVTNFALFLLPLLVVPLLGQQLALTLLILPPGEDHLEHEGGLLHVLLLLLHVLPLQVRHIHQQPLRRPPPSLFYIVSGAD